ncbi:MAG: hypothetical protein EOO21_04665, partial [Comamonadaceae bacterium]
MSFARTRRTGDAANAGSSFSGTGASSLAYSTFVGGTLDKAGNPTNGPVDNPTGVTLVGSAVAISGTTDTSDLRTTAGAIRTTNNGDSGFLWVVRPNGQGAADLVYGTYYGTNLVTGGLASRGNVVYIAGSTAAAGDPVPNGYKGTSTGGTDALVAAFTLDNNAPVLSGANAFAPILEDASSSPGTLVRDLVAGRLSDLDPMAQAGVAVVAADTPNGSWQYTLD